MQVDACELVASRREAGEGVQARFDTCVAARYALVDPELCQLCFQQPGRDSLRHVAHGGVGSHR